MTDRRRPLGTGPRLVDTELPGAPRAPLAAERLATRTDGVIVRAPVRPDGRRVLGDGPATDGV